MERIYCAVCGKPRRIDLGVKCVRTVSIGVMLSGIGAAVLWGAVWLVVGAFAWTVGEFVFRVLRRERSQCPHCRFDPYMAKADREKLKKIMLEYARPNPPRMGTDPQIHGDRPPNPAES